MAGTNSNQAIFQEMERTLFATDNHKHVMRLMAVGEYQRSGKKGAITIPCENGHVNAPGYIPMDALMTSSDISDNTKQALQIYNPDKEAIVIFVAADNGLNAYKVYKLS